jgi:SAM-dependent methyltransferase
MNDDWVAWRERTDLDAYDRRWKALADTGANPHGEADRVAALLPAGGGTVLDAGCGTGRVAIELARRGHHVVGTDLDADMLDRARRKAPDLTWIDADLATLDLGTTFDVVVAAGNVIRFVRPADRAAAVQRAAEHVAPGGRLVVGFQLVDGGPTVEEYLAWCAAAGLLAERLDATWDGEPYANGDYLVAQHIRPLRPPSATTDQPPTR